MWKEAVLAVFAGYKRRGYESPFDTYNQEAFESILGYAIILYDNVSMFHLLVESDVFDEDSE